MRYSSSPPRVASPAEKNPELEAELAAARWPDYRGLTATEATIEFARAYFYKHAHEYHKNIDASKAPFIFLREKAIVFWLDSDRAFQKIADIDDLHRARQYADKLGMPYSFYLSVAYQVRLDYWKRPHLPRPNQLYSLPIIEAAIENWHEIGKSWQKRYAVVRSTSIKNAHNPAPKLSPGALRDAIEREDHKKNCFGKFYSEPNFVLERDQDSAKNICQSCELAPQCRELSEAYWRAVVAAEPYGSARAALASGDFAGKARHAMMRVAADEAAHDLGRTVTRAKWNREARERYDAKHPGAAAARKRRHTRTTEAERSLAGKTFRSSNPEAVRKRIAREAKRLAAAKPVEPAK